MVNWPDILLGAVCTALIGGTPVLYRSIRINRDFRHLLYGRKDIPGLPGIAPLGDRLLSLERIVKRLARHFNVSIEDNEDEDEDNDIMKGKP